jgi:Flp pilus assembly protein TadD
MGTNSELFARAVACHQSGDLRQAEELYLRIAQAEPGHASVHHLLGLLAYQSGRNENAADLIRHAIALSPGNANFHCNLGIVLVQLGQVDQAEVCFRQALTLKPDYADAHCHLGSALQEQGKLDKAAEAFREALRHNPRLTNAYLGLGKALHDQGQYAEELECLRNALAIEPANSKALWTLAFVRLLHGDFEGGWPLYEQRWAQAGTRPRFEQYPRWDGSPLAGKTLLIHAEQGLGDTLQFIRYATQVKEHGGTVLFECPPALVHVLEGVAGVDRFVRQGESPPPFDVQIPLLSLPGLFGTRLTSIPAPNPYLSARSELIESWRHQLEPLSEFKIGIAWRGNPVNPYDRWRSLSLNHFQGLARQDGVTVVSLQVGPGADETAALAESLPVRDLGARLDRNGAFLDTAAVIMNLDLVVTVDSVVAHLAGALGKPVWVLLPFVPDWRWLLNRTDCPWYPTMRLFRQPSLGNWDIVFDLAIAEVRRLIEARAGRQSDR